MENQEKIASIVQEKNDVQTATSAQENQKIIKKDLVLVNNANITPINKEKFVNVQDNSNLKQKRTNYGLYLAIANYWNQNKKNEKIDSQLAKLDDQARNAWYEISTNVYDEFVLPLNENQDFFKQFVEDIFGNDWDKITASDDLVIKIKDQKKFIKQEKKRLKIAWRNFFNHVIFFFCFLLIGLLFLSIYLKNRKFIQQFNELRKNIDQKMDELNQEKIGLLNDVYTQPNLVLINHYLSFFGIRILHEYNKLNIHNIIPDNKEKICSIMSVVPFKVGNHVFINYAYWNEEWFTKTTTGSIACTYPVITTDFDGNVRTEIETEIVYAYHHEPTPVRRKNNNVYTVFDENATEYYWQLTSKLNNGKKSKKNSAFAEKNRKQSELSNVEFNQHYEVKGIEDNDLKTLTIMNSYLTPYTQSTILKIGKYYSFAKISAKFGSGYFVAKNYYSYYWLCNWMPISSVLDYNKHIIGGSESLLQLDKILLNLLNELMYIPCILWAMDTAANNMLNFDKKYDWKLGKGYTDEYKYADLETIVSQAWIASFITTTNADAFKYANIYRFHSFMNYEDVDIYDCDLISYYTTNEIDIVPVQSVHCGVVNVSVPYIKYHDFKEIKTFFVYKNTTSLLGKFYLSSFQSDQYLIDTLGDSIALPRLICTPELKIMIINEVLDKKTKYHALIEWLKQVDEKQLLQH